MRILDKLEKRFAAWAVPNVVLYLIIGQLAVYALILAGRLEYGRLTLFPAAVLEAGEWWRVLTFLIVPPSIAYGAFSALLLAIFWYIFWLMSSALESAWGVVRFNIFLLAGIFFSVAGAFLGHLVSPAAGIQVAPDFLFLSIFLSFATLHPNFEILLFFVLPVKMKYLGWFAAAGLVLSLLFAGSMGERLAILAPILNFLLFFWPELTGRVKARQRRSTFEAKRKAAAKEAFHVCENCGATDRSHPEREFRYKTVDGEAVCLCEECRTG